MWRWLLLLLLRVHYVAEILFLLRQGTKTWTAVACTNLIPLHNTVINSLFLNSVDLIDKWEMQKQMKQQAKTHAFPAQKEALRETIVTLEEEDEEEGGGKRVGTFRLLGRCWMLPWTEGTNGGTHVGPKSPHSLSLSLSLMMGPAGSLGRRAPRR